MWHPKIFPEPRAVPGRWPLSHVQKLYFNARYTDTGDAVACYVKDTWIPEYNDVSRFTTFCHVKREYWTIDGALLEWCRKGMLCQVWPGGRSRYLSVLDCDKL